MGTPLPGVTSAVDQTTADSAGGQIQNLFDPRVLAQAVTRNQQNVQQQAGELQDIAGTIGKNVATTVTDAAAAHGQYTGALDALMQQITDTNTVISDASEKERIGRYIPPGASALMSLFGYNEYDSLYQSMRKKEALENLQLANEKTAAIGNIARTKQEQAEFELRAKETGVRAGMEAASTGESSARTLIALQQETEREQSVQLSRMTDQQIAQATKDPTVGQKLGIPQGLIEADNKRRQALNLNLNQLDLNVQHLKATYPLEEAKLAGEVDLAQTRIPLEKQALLMNAKAGVLGQMSMPNLQKMLKDAQSNPDGTTQLTLPSGQTLPVSDRELSTAIATYQKQQAQDADLLAKGTVDTATISSFAQDAPNFVARVKTQLDGVVKPEDLSQIENNSAAISVLADRAKNGDRVASSAGAALYTKVQEMVTKGMTEFEKDKADRAPAIKEFVNRGFINDPVNAQKFLADTFKDSGVNGVTPGNFYFNDAGEVLRGFNRDYPGVYKIMPSGMPAGAKGQQDLASSMLRNVPPASQAFSDWLNKTYAPPEGSAPNTAGRTNLQKIQDSVNSRLYTSYLTNAVRELASVKPDGGAVVSFADKYVDGKLRDNYQTPDGMKKLLADLAAEDVQKGTKNLELLMGHINNPDFQRRMASDYVKQVTNDPVSAAISKMATNNMPGIAVQQIRKDLGDFSRGANRAKEQASIQNLTTDPMTGMSASDAIGLNDPRLWPHRENPLQNPIAGSRAWQNMRGSPNP